MTTPTPDPKERTRKEWTLGSYAVLAQAFLPLAAKLVDAAGIREGDRVLDVACGTGNVALTALRRGADVTGVDITPAMLDAARERASIVGADVDWREGDGADLPFEGDAFDVSLSCLGHMFVPDPAAAGSELVRVTRPGGTVAYVAWTPESGVGAMMGVLASYLPKDPDQSPPPFLWADPDTVRDRFGDRVTDLRFETGTLSYPALSPAHFWQSMTTDSGGIMLAREDVDENARVDLDEEAVASLGEFFSEEDNTMGMEYRVVTATVA